MKTEKMLKVDLIDLVKTQEDRLSTAATVYRNNRDMIKQLNLELFKMQEIINKQQKEINRLNSYLYTKHNQPVDTLTQHDAEQTPPDHITESTQKHNENVIESQPPRNPEEPKVYKLILKGNREFKPEYFTNLAEARERFKELVLSYEDCTQGINKFQSTPAYTHYITVSDVVFK